MEAGVSVLIVGAGPVGLTLACELARHGVRSRIVEKSSAPSPYCRAVGVTARTLEVWDQMGVVDRMTEAGLWLTGLRSVLNGGPAEDSPIPDFGLPYGHLALPQPSTESILAAHLDRFGLAIERGVALEALSAMDAGIDAVLTHTGGRRETAHYAYVVGCDGAHSVVRKQAGIEFEGEAFPMPFMLGDVRVDWDLPAGMAYRAVVPRPGTAPDFLFAVPLPDAGHYRISMLASPDLSPAGNAAAMSADGGHGIQSELPGPSLAQLQAVVNRLVPGQPALSELRWSSIFRISVRLADTYRRGGVFIAGDAAHIHPPTGGQGMNTGIQDAHNLAWKLALALRGLGGEALLDSYAQERRTEGLDLLRRTRAAAVGFGQRDDREDSRLVDTQVLISYRQSPVVLDELADAPGVRAGDRLPDLQNLRCAGYGFERRLQEFLRDTAHVLLVVPAADAPGDVTATAAALADTRELLRQRTPLQIRAVLVSPVTCAAPPGVVVAVASAVEITAVFGTAGGAYLVRPDGYVGWRGPVAALGAGGSDLARSVSQFLERY